MGKSGELRVQCRESTQGKTDAETHLPAEQPPQKEDPWISGAYAHDRRAERHQAAARTGSDEADPLGGPASCPPSIRATLRIGIDQPGRRGCGGPRNPDSTRFSRRESAPRAGTAVSPLYQERASSESQPPERSETPRNETGREGVFEKAYVPCVNPSTQGWTMWSSSIRTRFWRGAGRFEGSLRSC